MYQIRIARRTEVQTILELFGAEVRAGRMLPRQPGEVYTNIDDWLVAEQEGEIIGCASLVFFNDELCEVRSLAVHPDYQGNGLGSALVKATLDLARERAARRVLTLTRSAALFERVGFKQDQVHNFPEKVWRDCRPCPFRHCCDEVALLYNLDKEE